MLYTLRWIDKYPHLIAIALVHKEKNMDTHSINRAAGLPREGEPVEFVLEGREVALNGTYVEHVFRSRYSGYAVERVRSWRPADRAEHSSIPGTLT